MEVDVLRAEREAAKTGPSEGWRLYRAHTGRPEASTSFEHFVGSGNPTNGSQNQHEGFNGLDRHGWTEGGANCYLTRPTFGVSKWAPRHRECWGPHWAETAHRHARALQPAKHAGL